MIKLFSLKQEKEAEKASPSGDGKIAPGLIRMQKDVSELRDNDKGVSIDFYNGKDDLMNFKVKVSPDEGYYRKGQFVFDVKVPKTYPHDAPKVLCETRVYHPNIDMEGHVCLNILREDWKPVLTIQSVIHGLQFLMLEPNADDPLNKEAANLLATDGNKFEKLVRSTFRGGSMVVAGQSYVFPQFPS
eukprot:CAMPEP_0115845976 /NCGR_PEP_ID=MMETSP0287-20121206/9628_1 /TAXON_ID=412157 /ORGANISM="Chrysochromulina rotalis, Strain UIO044" /LENGTH=186 /DNA_ID=CAMNT_0003299763 /DNA_START=213 /DNA_END=773 /DNA_ORIENTATION=-